MYKSHELREPLVILETREMYVMKKKYGCAACMHLDIEADNLCSINKYTNINNCGRFIFDEKFTPPVAD